MNGSYSLTGSAGLWIDGEGERDLRPGDHLVDPGALSSSCDADGEQ